jgi:hypothetical protein
MFGLMRLNINTSAVVQHTNRLERMSKTTLPKVLARTMNDVAFDVKKNTLQKTATKKFTIRSKNFFKVYSRVEMAKPGKIETIHSKIGMTEKGLKGPNNKSVDNLEKQEAGGQITNKSFIPTKDARGGTNTKLVKASLRLNAIKNAVRTSQQRGKNPRENWKRAAYKAGRKGFVISERGMYQINSLKQTKTNLEVKSRKIYDYEKGRSVKVKARNFMEQSSRWSASKVEKFYIKNASKMLEKS